MFQPFSLTGRVDRSAPTMPGDVLATKSALQRLGRYTPRRGTITPHTDEPLFDGILAFQKDRNLVKDGVMKPNGPTAKLINGDLWRQDNSTTPPAFTLGGGVGEGAGNAPGDVANARTALAWAGFFPADKTGGRPDSGDPEFRIGLARFQRAFNLARDGIMNPRGETEKTLAKVINPMVWTHLRRQRGQNSRAEATLTATKINETATTEQRVEAEPESGSAVKAGADNVVATANRKTDERGDPDSWQTDYEQQDPFTYTRIPKDRRGEWDAMIAATERAKLGRGERRAFMEIFTVEGGTKPDGTTVAGIRIGTLEEISDKVLKDGGISPSATPKELTDDQRIYVYQAYFNLPHVLGNDGGPGALNALNDGEVAAAIADTLFREGGFGGMSAINRAANVTVSGTLLGEELVRKDTLVAVASLIENKATRRALLHAIAELRLKLRPNESQRINHFRFQR